MAIKCGICGAKIETLYLDKIAGTYIGRGKKKVAVCSQCQKRYGDKIKEMAV